MNNLWNVDRALALVLERITPLSAERAHLTESLGRVLAQDISAEENLPPFPNSSMDGFAVRASNVAQASPENPVQLRVTLDIAAGSAPAGTIGDGEAARIMTGAPMPAGADAVIPVERTDHQWTPGANTVLPPTVNILRHATPGDNVRLAGEDIRAGQVVLRAGSILRAQEIGVLASLGSVMVPVVKQPRVVILSTGDELVDIDQTLTPGKIRDSNGYALAALVTTYGGQPIRLPTARDTLEDVRSRFHEALTRRPDLILTSAGMSVGAFDVVRTVLEELGEVNFYRINLRPGKPLAFGQLQGVPFFGLPGNPVSALVTFDVFVRPALLKLGQREDHLPTISAITGEDIHSDGRRSYLRVRLHENQGQLIAKLTGSQSSGVLTSMVLADGLLIVPEDVTYVPAGTSLPVRLLR